MKQPHNFEADRLAYYEKAGWQAYYERRWLRVFWLMTQLIHTQYHLPWLRTLAAALDTARAAKAFALLGHDLLQVKRHLTAFYTKAKGALDIKASAEHLAKLELTYWLVHRDLAMQRQQAPENDDIEPMIQALAELHAALFNATPEAMRPSAEWRALAAKTVDDITGERSTNVAADWARIEDYLQRAYQAVHEEG